MKTRTRKVSVKCITNEAELLIINRKLFNERLRYDTFCHEYFTQRAKTKNANLRSQLNSVKQGWYTIELPNAPFPGKQFDKNSILFNEQKAKQHITKLIQTNSLEKGNTHYSSKKKNFDFIQKIMPEKFRIFDYFHQCSSAIQINDQISKEKNSLQQNAFISIENNEIHENNNSSSNINNNNINNSNNNSFNHYLFNRNSNQQQNVFDPLSQNFHTQIQINTILRFGNIQRLKNIKQHVHTRVVQDINLEKIFYENDSNLDSSTVSGKSVIQNPMVSKLRALNKNKSLGSTQIFRSESLSNLSPFKSTLTSKRNSLASLGDSASFINVEDQSQSLAVSRDNSFINIKTNFKTGFNLPSTHQSKKHPSMSESSCTDSIFVKSIEQKLEQISPTKTNLKYLSMKIAPITEQPTSKPRAKFIRIDNSVLEKD